MTLSPDELAALEIYTPWWLLFCVFMFKILIGVLILFTIFDISWSSWWEGMCSLGWLY